MLPVSKPDRPQPIHDEYTVAFFRPFPTNGSQLFHALEGAFDNIHGVGLKHSSFFTPSGLLSFSQLDRKHWPISEGQFFDNFVAGINVVYYVQNYIKDRIC